MCDYKLINIMSRPFTDHHHSFKPADENRVHNVTQSLKLFDGPVYRADNETARVQFFCGW